MGTTEGLPRVIVSASTPDLGQEVVQRLIERGYPNVGLRTRRTDASAIRHRPDLPFPHVVDLLQFLSPLNVAEVRPHAGIDEGFDIELRLGDRRPLSRWDVSLFVDSERIAKELCEKLGSLGFRVERVQFRSATEDRMEFGGASCFARQLVQWVALNTGIRLAERKLWGESDRDIWLHARDPQLIHLPPRRRFPVRVYSDDQSFADQVAERLAALDFRPEVGAGAPAGRSDRFFVEPGPLALTRDGADAEALHEAVRELVGQRGVAHDRFPLQHGNPDPKHRSRRLLPDVLDLGADDSLGAYALVNLPVLAVDRGELRPYAGAFPGRFDVIVRTDDMTLGEQVASRLRTHGYRSVDVQEPGGDVTVPGMKVGAEAPVWEQVAGTVREVVSDVLGRPVSEDDLPAIPGSKGGSVIEIDLLTSADAERTRRRTDRLREAHAVTLHLPTRAWGELFERAPELEAFATCDTRERNSGVYRIEYGSAKAAVIRPLSLWLEALTGARPDLVNRWHDADHDIYITLPRDLAKRAAGRLAQSGDCHAPTDPQRARTANKQHPGPFLERRDGKVRVGAVELAVRPEPAHPYVPRRRSLGAFCVDQTVADTLQHVAYSVALGEPCLLEGETATSKTSVISYLASWLRQPVVRLNLHGQTDTSELVGRYVPDTDTSPPAGASHRSGWRWQHGLVVRAMLEGWWLVLDELNLAEPHVLERLNPVLERCPSLVLTEHDGAVIGSGSTPVHRSFRVFGTMNPGRYEGRNALSPAFLDRWTGYCRVAPPGEREIGDTLRHWKSGEQPAVIVEGTEYRPWAEALAALAGLQHVPDATLESVARFHTAAFRRFSEASDRLGLGTQEVTVTRRLLERAISFLARRFPEEPDTAVAAMLERYYYARCPTTEARDNLVQLAVATGLVEGTSAPLSRPARRRRRRLSPDRVPDELREFVDAMEREVG